MLSPDVTMLICAKEMFGNTAKAWGLLTTWQTRLEGRSMQPLNACALQMQCMDVATRGCAVQGKAPHPKIPPAACDLQGTMKSKSGTLIRPFSACGWTHVQKWRHTSNHIWYNRLQAEHTYLPRVLQVGKRELL